MEGAEKKLTKPVIITIIILGLMIAIYLCFALFFTNHFYFGTKVNNINISGKTLDEANELIANDVSNYKLTLLERLDTQEEILGSNIDIKYKNTDKTKEIKENQSSIGWIVNIFNNKNFYLDLMDYDEQKLKDEISKLPSINSNDVINPKNAVLVYNEGGYEIVPEVEGNSLNPENLYNAALKAIVKGEKELDLDKNDCYNKPQYTSNSEEVLNAKEMLDKYSGTKITYKLNSDTEIIDGSVIKDWLDVNNNYEVSINEDKVKKYVKTLGEKYNTVGKTRNFTTTNGSNVSVSGGDYGWKLDTSEDTKYLVESIKEGKNEEKDAKYSQKAISKDDNTIGNTYVEISIPNQHLWFYKNGSLIVEGPVVTGNTSLGRGTPQGTYKLDYKERHATLKGEGYSTPVDFWMPFNGGIGIHDATWRGNFGGSIYMSNGSHGCVNAPYSLANTIFNNIDEGTPIVCYY